MSPVPLLALYFAAQLGRLLVLATWRSSLVLGGLLVPLNAAARAERGLPAEALALPVLSQVGVIPVQVESEQGGGLAGLERSVSYLEDECSAALRDQQRFHVVEDELVKAMWQTPALRAELQDDYELSAFFHLTVSPRGDAVVLVARLLGPDLEPYLQEEATIGRQAFQQAERATVRRQCSGLLAQLINRLPVDVSVSSVQGSYVTLGGGSQQGVALGDRLALERVWVVERHPVLKTWRNFKRQPVGEVKVIEVNEQVAIAEIVRLVRDDDVRAGDGSRIANIASRLRFARPQADPSALAGADTIIVAPLYPAGQSSHPKRDRLATTLGEPSGLTEEAEARQEAAGEPSELASRDEGEGVNRETLSLGPPAAADEDEPQARRARPAGPSRLAVHVGQRGWSYLGPGSTGSRLTWYLPVNQLALSYEQALAGKWQYRAESELLLGKTRAGLSHYNGYGARGRIFWEDQLSLLQGGVEHWQAGATAELAGIALARGAFGGYDLLYGGVYAGLSGRLPETLASLGALEWYAELHLIPLTFGRLGYDNALHSLRSAFGWQCVAGVWQRVAPQQPSWGLSVAYDSHLLLDDSGESTALNQYQLWGALRWPLP